MAKWRYNPYRQSHCNALKKTLHWTKEDSSQSGPGSRKIKEDKKKYEKKWKKIKKMKKNDKGWKKMLKKDEKNNMWI